MMEKLKIDIVSDVVCPWCVIGFKNLQKAINQMEDKVEFEVEWKPYELHPEIPEKWLRQETIYATKIWRFIWKIFSLHTDNRNW